MGRKKKSFTLLPLKDVDGKEHKEIEFSLWRNGIFPEIDSMTEDDMFYIYCPITIGLNHFMTTEDITGWLTENKIKGRKRIIETLKGFMMPEDIGRYFARISKLKQKQEDFCHYFAICLNAKHAAILAGYSERSARWIGPALLKKREIKSRIYEWHEETWGKAFRENARKRMIEEEERKEMKKHAALSRKR